ncbi:hypothetical protein LINGRAHAP2_LOCUS1493 [Linum grandiflorum]
MFCITFSHSSKPKPWFKPASCPGGGDACGKSFRSLMFGPTAFPQIRIWQSTSTSSCLFVLATRLSRINFYYYYYDLPVSSWETPPLDLFHKVMEYAGVHLSHLKFEAGEWPASSPMACRFKLITDMRLSYCSLHHGAFNDFPCLNFLRLFGCECTSLKLSGLELVRLEMQELFCESTIEVYAPKLKYFFYQSRIVDWNCFPKLDLPVLDRAYIRIQWTDMLLMENGAILRERANCASPDEPQYDHPLAGLNSLMKPGASPFTRLKTLKVEYLDGTPGIIPYQVIGFFFDGSPHSEDKSFELEKVELAKTDIYNYRVWI